MTEYMTEQEQIELIKGWIKQYSVVIIAGVCIAMIIVWGYQYWQTRQHKTLDHASIIYDKMLGMQTQNNAEATTAQAKRLYNRYPKTVYGQIALLMLARDAVLKKDYPTAEKHLLWVSQNSKSATFRQIAKTRLARLLIEMNQPAAALKQLEKVEDASYLGLINEIRGDAYLAMKNTKEARAAFQSALHDIPNAEVIRPILQMKYDNLAFETQQ